MIVDTALHAERRILFFFLTINVTVQHEDDTYTIKGPLRALYLLAPSDCRLLSAVRPRCRLGPRAVVPASWVDGASSERERAPARPRPPPVHGRAFARRCSSGGGSRGQVGAPGPSMGANGGFWTPFNAQSGSSLGGSLWFNVLGAAVGMLCAEDDTYSDDTYSDEHGQLLPETCMGARVE
jgi:hypothetical protein